MDEVEPDRPQLRPLRTRVFPGGTGEIESRRGSPDGRIAGLSDQRRIEDIAAWIRDIRAHRSRPMNAIAREADPEDNAVSRAHRVGGQIAVECAIVDHLADAPKRRSGNPTGRRRRATPARNHWKRGGSERWDSSIGTRRETASGSRACRPWRKARPARRRRVVPVEDPARRAIAGAEESRAVVPARQLVECARKRRYRPTARMPRAGEHSADYNPPTAVLYCPMRDFRGGGCVQIRHVLSAGMFTVAVAGCSSGNGRTGPTVVSVSSVVVTPSSVNLVAGQSGALNALTLDANGDTLMGHTITWFSSDPAIVTVTEDGGLITAVAAGTATIRAVADNKTGNANITVAVPSHVTLLVTNGACAGTHCDSLRILAFPSTQPRTPGGYWSLLLGTIATPQLCVTIPPFGTFFIYAAGADGTISHTTAITWNATVALSLAALTPSMNRIMASPSSDAFVPTAAQGWRITLPGDAAAVPAAPCSP